jgi:hypothetical protein
MTDELNAAARIVAIVVDSLVEIRRAPPNGRAASDRLDYLLNQVQAYRRKWGTAATFAATDTYVVTLIEAAARAPNGDHLLESSSQ